MVWTVRIVLVLLALLGAAPLHAVQVDEILPDPVLEARAREISRPATATARWSISWSRATASSSC